MVVLWAGACSFQAVPSALIVAAHSRPEKFRDFHHKVEYQADHLNLLQAYQE
jgi:hypothetical protein